MTSLPGGFYDGLAPRSTPTRSPKTRPCRPSKAKGASSSGVTPAPKGRAARGTQAHTTLRPCQRLRRANLALVPTPEVIWVRRCLRGTERRGVRRLPRGRGRAGGASGFGYAASGGAAAAGRRALRAGAGGRGVRYRGMCAPRTGGVGGVRARRAGGQLFLGTCEASSAAAFARTQPWRLRKRLRLSWGCAFITLGACKRVTDRQRHGAEAQTPRYVPGAKASREAPFLLAEPATLRASWQRPTPDLGLCPR